MKIETYPQKSKTEICFLLEPHRVQDCYRWLRNNDLPTPKTVYANYKDDLQLFSITVETKPNQHLIKKLQAWSDLEAKYKHYC